jgi:hypothetical protein
MLPESCGSAALCERRSLGVSGTMMDRLCKFRVQRSSMEGGASSASSATSQGAAVSVARRRSPRRPKVASPPFFSVAEVRPPLLFTEGNEGNEDLYLELGFNPLRYLCFLLLLEILERRASRADDLRRFFCPRITRTNANDFF